MDCDLVMDEFDLVANLLLHACRQGLARLDAPGGTVADIPADVRVRLAEELDPLIDEYQRVWLARNRPGGLADSVSRLEALLAQYQA
ncbi:MAG: hypothetical protein JXN59_19045, partial [Anaerolineae bacterium]|nr:hypothetical protein [Anaerolineae bacterium]